MAAFPVRRPNFSEHLARVSKYPAGDGDMLASHIGMALSAQFPDGEDFFVRSVRRHRNLVSDPDLLAQINAFIGQESVHGREHRAFNERMAAYGYPTKGIEQITRRTLEWRERRFSAIASLAVTAALEHFTATLAEKLMTDPAAQAMLGTGVQRELFLWHAVEEAEHKSVAFDVYRAAGGNERMRILTMRIVRVTFFTATALMVAYSVLTDPDTYRHPRQFLASLRRLPKLPLFDRDVRQRLRQYDEPNFHPSQIETDHLVAEWSTRLFGPGGVLQEAPKAS